MRKIILIAFFLGILLGLFLFIFKPKTTQGIAGTIDLNGITPQGSTIILSQKIANSPNNYVTFAQDLPAQDGTVWAFPQAEKGKSYEIQAAVVANNNVITQSSPIFVTAPAMNEAIVLNVSSENIAAASLPTPAPNPATISGTIGVNGYIPPGATISVEGRTQGKTDFTVVASDLPGIDNQVMTYATAITGRTYEVVGYLYDNNGNQIGSSNILTVTAPAQNEVLNINSTAQAPITPTATPAPTNQPTTPPAPATGIISGSINFNGAAPINSRIVVFQRVSGTAQFQVAVDNLSPTDGTTWSWAGGTVGTSYDLLAILKQRQSNGTDTDIANANIITVSAPASGETFNINSGFSLPQASGTISVACNDYDNGSQTWQASVSFQSITNASSYWIQIGTSNGGVELTNQTQNATNNPTQTDVFPFKNNVTYYARYAYAYAPNQLANSSQFSPLSNTQALRCSQ